MRTNEVRKLEENNPPPNHAYTQSKTPSNTINTKAIIYIKSCTQIYVGMLVRCILVTMVPFDGLNSLAD